MESFLEALRAMSPGQAAALLLAENLVIFGLALAVSGWFTRRWAGRPVAAPPLPLERVEVLLAACTVLLNTAVTLCGWALWRAGHIRFRPDFGLGAVLDVLVLLFVMDAAMYWLHRLGHHRWLFPVLHATHHRYDRPRPLTLFVLNPAETLSFGVLWLAVIAVYPASWAGMSVYLALNVAFGALGHLGVEPFPARWARAPLLRHLGSSTFHARHHQDRAHNFGFYTLLWDRLFGTLDPRHEQGFGRPPSAGSR